MSKISESKVLFWLSLPRISARKQTEILRYFGSTEKLWDNFISEYGRIEQFAGKDCATELKRFHNKDFLDLTLEKLRQDGISVITAANPKFPKLLLQPEVGAPLVMYYNGNIDILNDDCVAVVGTRRCTNYGKEMAKVIATDLAENGITVVSGLATGIDAYAHAAVVEAGGKAIAVLGSGLNKFSPVGNIKLRDRIIENGGIVITEYKPNDNATAFTFPQRNRIISGLSLGVAVVEADEDSGALITANFALEQNREVFALPGDVTSSRSKGCNNLLFNGANFIRNGMDILEYLSIKPVAKKEKTEIIVDKDEKMVYSLLGDDEVSLDGLIEKSGYPPAELLDILTRLELGGVIKRLSANTYVRANRN